MLIRNSFMCYHFIFGWYWQINQSFGNVLQQQQQSELLTKQTLHSTDCDKGWYRFQQSCYKMFTVEEYYKDAILICNSKNAKLVTILSQNENQYVTDLIASFSEYHETWIGLKRGQAETFRWEHNNGIVDFNNWMLDKPNGDGGCTQMISSGFWNNINCYNRLPMVCKKDKRPPVVDDKLGLILNISIPLSCVFIMFCFVAFLCFKSWKELAEIKCDNLDGKPFALIQAAMILPLKGAPDLLNSNGKNLWKGALEKLKQEQIKNNPLNQPSTFLSRGSSNNNIFDNNNTNQNNNNNAANQDSGSFADIVNSLLTKRRDTCTDGMLGLPIISNPNIPSISINKCSDKTNNNRNSDSDQLPSRETDIDQSLSRESDSDQSATRESDKEQSVRHKNSNGSIQSDLNSQKNSSHSETSLNSPNNPRKRISTGSNNTTRSSSNERVDDEQIKDQKVPVFKHMMEVVVEVNSKAKNRNKNKHITTHVKNQDPCKRKTSVEDNKRSSVISNSNCSTIDDENTSANPLSRNEFRESIRRESQRRKDKYFPTSSPEKKDIVVRKPRAKKKARKAIAADYAIVTLV